ncbi:phage portal protein [Heyndrickxia acidicola]|uniref:Phage portal protein n=1 Tax=Heyndrickxia acidicola TaxID=209389 RepID=A0ABU6MMC8_9BACI|nr:phage portal protein [Heyndrickxia acidicola]MED1205840.1 phage portal protein [Heyndrickxia acidicola]
MSMWSKMKQRIFKNFIKSPVNRLDFTNLQGSYFFGSAAEMHESIFSAVNKMSNMLASLPIELYDGNYNKPTDCPEYNLLSNGFRYFTQFDWLKDVETMRNLTGNAYMMKFRNVNGQVVDWGVIRSDACEPLIDLNSGELWYSISAVDNRLFQQTMYVHCSEILHFKHMRFNGVKGINPIKLLQGTLDYDQQIRKISLDQLIGNNEGFIVNFETQMDDDAKKALVQNIASFYKENGGILIEENGTTIKRIERELVDTNLINVDKVTRSKVAMVYNLPEHFLGDANSNYASLEQLNLEFLTGNLRPTLTQYEQELSRKCLTDAQRAKGYHFRVNYRSLLKADLATSTAYYQAAIRNGWMTQNEVRMLEGNTPFPSPIANTLLMSGDLYPIDTPIADRKGGEKQSESTTQNTN